MLLYSGASSSLQNSSIFLFVWTKFVPWSEAQGHFWRWIQFMVSVVIAFYRIRCRQKQRLLQDLVFCLKLFLTTMLFSSPCPFSEEGSISFLAQSFVLRGLRGFSPLFWLLRPTRTSRRLLFWRQPQKTWILVQWFYLSSSFYIKSLFCLKVHLSKYLSFYDAFSAFADW